MSCCTCILRIPLRMRQFNNFLKTNMNIPFNVSRRHYTLMLVFVLKKFHVNQINFELFQIRRFSFAISIVVNLGNTHAPNKCFCLTFHSRHAVKNMKSDKNPLGDSVTQVPCILLTKQLISLEVTLKR